MLSERVRNTIVGVTMLAGLGSFMFGAFLLGKFSSIHSVPPYNITVLAPESEGLNAGDKVTFNDVSIGSVQRVDLTPEMRGVKILLAIDHWVDVPADAVAYIGKPPTVGNAYVTLRRPSDSPTTDSAQLTMLPKEGNTPVVQGLMEPGLQAVVNQLNHMVPRIQTAVDRVSQVGGDLHELLEKRPLADFDSQDPKTRVANISVMVQQISRVMGGVDSLVNDPQTRKSFHEILDNVHDTTADLRAIAKRIDDTLTRANTAIDDIGNTARQVGAAATQASATLDTTRVEIIKTTQRVADILVSLQKATDSLSSDKGTVGKFLNDPRLYDSILDLTRNLKSTTDDLKVLVQKWTEEGATLHLK